MALQLYGNNKVFCKGRFIGGPDVRSCAGSALLIGLPSAIWQAEVGVFLAERYSVLLPLLVGALQAASLLLLLATAFSDPGIVPRQKDFGEQYDGRSKSFRAKQPPRFHEVLLRGHPFKMKFCSTCNIYRPPRTSHCSVCEDCVERFDHHCPWIGNCIGKRNYWLFYSFVAATGSMNVLVLATAVAHLGVLSQEHRANGAGSGGNALVRAMRQEPLTAALVVYCALVVWFTVGLCGYHSYLVALNQTTYEQIRGVYAEGPNPFDRGPAGNFRDVLCGGVRPRYFNGSTGELLWPWAARAGGRAPAARRAPGAG